MDNLGFVRSKTDIEYLILYVLSFINEAVQHDELAEMCMIDGGFGYFDFSDALAELVSHGNVENEDDFFRISESGRTAAGILSRSLPLHVREEAKRAAAKVGARIRRSTIIKTARERRPDGSIALKLSCVDGSEVVYSIELMVTGEEQASVFERNFKKNAERIYDGLLCVLLNDYSSEE